MKLRFQWMMARRYLGRDVARSWTLHFISLSFFILPLAGQLVRMWMSRSHSVKVQMFRASWDARIFWFVFGSAALFVLIAIFVALMRKLTLFATISIFGLLIGSASLVVALAVMSGFESDLQRKIIGTNAHVVVTRDDPFTDYQDVMKRVRQTQDVVAVTPYLSSELMLSSATNVSGVLVKGIDTETVSSVTDLGRNVEIGNLGYLEHPEKLRSLGGMAIPEDEPKPHEDDKVHEDDKKAAKKKKAHDEDVLHFRPIDSHGNEVPEPEAHSEERRVLPGVIVGRELAKTLRVYIGDDVDLISPLGGIGPTGPIPKSKPFRVAGIFFSGFFEYDSKYAYLSLPSAQKFLDDSAVTGLEVRVRDPEHSERVVAHLKEQLGGKFHVEDWKSLNRSLFSALKIEKAMAFIALCFIILVAAFSIIATGMMLVMEKGRQIAILKSMGTTDGTVLGIFVLLGLYMGAIGTTLGILIGVAASGALSQLQVIDTDVYYMTQLPVKMHGLEVLAVFGAAIVIALGATLYPAWKAAQLRPVDGLRND